MNGLQKLYVLYAAVVKLVKTNPEPHNETNLMDWIEEGDTENMTPQEIATEWDEVNSQQVD